MTAYVVDTISPTVAEKFRLVEAEIARQRGDFALFGLFELEDHPGKWDPVAAAPWLDTESNKIAALIDAVQEVFPLASGRLWRLFFQ